MSKSVLPVEAGVSNPYFSRAMEFLRSSGEVRQIVADIQSLSRDCRRTNPGKSKVDIAKLLALCKDQGVKERMRAVFDRTVSPPPNGNLLGPPPSTKHIYGRFGKATSLIDIGSGNLNKLVKYTGYLKITSVDPLADVCTPHVINVHRMFFSVFAEKMAPDPYLTSFMALCQLTPKEQELALQYDGIHMVPDHNVLMAMGAAKADGNMVRVKTPIREYVDHKIPDGGFDVDVGYRILASFKTRTISVELQGLNKNGDYKAVVDCRPRSYLDLNFGDMGYKYDGTAWELESKGDGTCFLTNRNGDWREGTIDVDFHFAAIVEELDTCYVLLRLEMWRGCVVPHCGDTLRAFTDRVHLRINQRLVYGPKAWSPGVPCTLTSNYGPAEQPRVDGIISRMSEKDYYFKPRWTADLLPDGVARLKEKGEELGFVVNCDEQPGLYEYELCKYGSVVNMKPVRLRTDKCKATRLDTVLYMLEHLDLGEYAALFGTTPALY